MGHLQEDAATNSSRGLLGVYFWWLPDGGGGGWRRLAVGKFF